MRRRERDRLHDMLDAALKAVALAEGRTAGDIHTDETLALALTRLLEVVGEAANHVSDETRAAIPEIPWRKVTGMRNRLIHAYFAVELSIVWETVTDDLPPLIKALEAALEEE